MIKNSNGFSLVELMISMALLLLSLAAASTIFSNILIPFKQQTKIAETNIEGIIGLDLLRRDIEHAGYGLPWTYSGTLPGTYQEATTTPASSYNDTASSPPRALLTGNNMTFSSPNNIFNGSDYLVIKAVNVARNATAQRWTRLGMGDSKRNGLSGDNFENADRVIVISPGSTDANSRSLSVSGTAFYTTYNNTSSFAPSDATDTRIIYGVDPDTDLKMPFNRADYYIRKFDSNGNDIVPSRCATKTGVLEKVVVNQGDGRLTNFLPLLDCVADMQVVYRLDMNDNGTISTQSNADGSTVSSSEGATVTTVQATLASASLLRSRLKEVRVYILAHEGQSDLNYTYPNSTITVGEYGLGSTFNLSSTIGSTYANYRWKVYTIVVKTVNLK